MATGPRHLAEARRSLESVRRAMPHTPVALFADRADVPGFDRVYPVPGATRTVADKLPQLLRTPFTKTLYLDTDTWMLEPVDELEALLDRFEFAYAHAPVRSGLDDTPGCNPAFPQANAGVLAYRWTPAVEALLRRWLELYLADAQRPGQRRADQPSLRQALYDMPVKATVLPPEYNLRTSYPYFVGGRSRARILHGRGPALAWARRTVNRTSEMRVGWLFGLVRRLRRWLRPSLKPRG